MQIGTKIIVITFCLFGVIATLSSTSPIPVKNPYFQTGKFDIIKVSRVLLLQIQVLPLILLETINSLSQELFPQSGKYTTQPVT